VEGGAGVDNTNISLLSSSSRTFVGPLGAKRASSVHRVVSLGEVASEEGVSDSEAGAVVDTRYTDAFA
jgi:hypothetical protein